MSDIGRSSDVVDDRQIGVFCGLGVVEDRQVGWRMTDDGEGVVIRA